MKDTYNENLHQGASKRLYQYGRELRKTQTEAEKILWEHLRGRKFHGLKFRRQHPIDKYVADFYCHEKKLVIELDGGIHDEKINKDYDSGRTNELADFDITVIRFRNEQVKNQLDDVLTDIFKFVQGNNKLF